MVDVQSFHESTFHKRIINVEYQSMNEGALLIIHALRKQVSSCKYFKVRLLTTSELPLATIPKFGASPQGSFFVQIFQGLTPHHKRASFLRLFQSLMPHHKRASPRDFPKFGASPQASFFVQIFQGLTPHHKRASFCDYFKV
ncbi:hypothetical protein ABFS82_03G009000 [Erythranthe guttata]